MQKRKLFDHMSDFALAGVCILVLGFCYLFFKTPDVEKLKDCLVTEMYKVRLCDEDPNFVKLEQVSPYITGAIIMSEDASFMYHDGVDVTEIKESFFKNLAVGKFARGGSTITQQLAKNVFLNGEKSISRKLQEIYLAFELEKIFTKKRILTLYLNVVEFAPDTFGIKKATHYYFNKEPAEVLPEEAAFLAFLLPNPKKYSQSFTKHQMTPFASKSVKTILHKMLRGHKISEDEYTSSLTRVSALFGGTEVDLNKILDQGTSDDENSSGDDDFKFENDLND
jgi:monofunctional glycosyltransferase